MDLALEAVEALLRDRPNRRLCLDFGLRGDRKHGLSRPVLRRIRIAFLLVLRLLRLSCFVAFSHILTAGLEVAGSDLHSTKKIWLAAVVEAAIVRKLVAATRHIFMLSCPFLPESQVSVAAVIVIIVVLVRSRLSIFVDFDAQVFCDLRGAIRLLVLFGALQL